MHRIVSAAALAVAVSQLTGCVRRADPEAERKALLQVDRDFAQATAARGVDGWVDYFADDGEMLPAGAGLLHGKKEIHDEMVDALGTPAAPGPLKLAWTPLRAFVSDAGDLGYTYGNYLATSQRGESKGKYTTIWRKQADGNWKVALDLGNQGEIPTEKLQNK